MSTLRVDNLRGQTADGVAKYVVQFIDTTFTTTTAINSDTYTTITDGTVTITPKFINSKIMIMVCLNVMVNDGNTNYVFGGFQFKRGSTVITQNNTDNSGPYELGVNIGGGSSTQLNTRASYNIIDSPNTTSATTYSIEGRCYNYSGVAGTLTVNRSDNTAGQSTIHAMEIAQ
jgi:hypothetical protein|tara:strand:- start:27 stop:545 length:519 start_codon:yes stop_codon:yes gene_type:complete